jgi:ABC-type sugar transport system permease subunit
MNITARIKRNIPNRNYHFKLNLTNYLGLAPFYILLFVFIVVPIIQGIARSFTDWSMGSRGNINFVGLANYKFLLSGQGTSSVRFLTYYYSCWVIYIVSACINCKAYSNKII